MFNSTLNFLLRFSDSESCLPADFGYSDSDVWDGKMRRLERCSMDKYIFIFPLGNCCKLLFARRHHMCKHLRQCFIPVRPARKTLCHTACILIVRVPTPSAGLLQQRIRATQVLISSFRHTSHSFHTVFVHSETPYSIRPFRNPITSKL